MRIYCRNGENLNYFAVVFSRDKTGLNGFARLWLDMMQYITNIPYLFSFFQHCLTNRLYFNIYTKQTILLSNMQQKDTIDW